MSEFGFFFFFKIAVEVSSSCVRRSVYKDNEPDSGSLTSFFSAPEASLVQVSAKVGLRFKVCEAVIHT